MIILMKTKQIKKNHDKLCGYRDFVIINCTTEPKYRDFHNVASDVVLSGNGRSFSSGCNSLAFQPAASMFDETVPSSRREELKTKFFMSESFEELFMTILSNQILNPKKNYYVCLENQVYDNLAEEFLVRFKEILNTDSIKGMIYLWDDVSGMRDLLNKIIEKKVGDDDVFDSIDFYFEESSKKKNAWKSDTLDDDEYDKYLDWVDIKNELDSAESNKTIRKLFIKNVELTKGKIKFLTKAVARYDKRTTAID